MQSSSVLWPLVFSRAAFAIAIAVALGCGVPVQRGEWSAPAEASLFVHLPRDLKRCHTERPGFLSREQRRLARLPLLLEIDWPVSEFALGETHSGQRVAAYRLSGTPEQIAEWVDARGLTDSPRASFPFENVLVVTLEEAGEGPARRSGSPLLIARCKQLLADSILGTAQQTDEGIALRSVRRTSDGLVEEHSAPRPFEFSLPLGTTQLAPGPEQTVRVGWDDLRLLLEDRDRERAAIAEAARRAAPGRLEEIDPTNRAEVRLHVGRWQSAIQRLRPGVEPELEERARSLVELQRILRAALEHFVDDEELLLAWANAYLVVPHEGQALLDALGPDAETAPVLMQAARAARAMHHPEDYEAWVAGNAPTADVGAVGRRIRTSFADGVPFAFSERCHLLFPQVGDPALRPPSAALSLRESELEELIWALLGVPLDGVATLWFEGPLSVPWASGREVISDEWLCIPQVSVDDAGMLRPGSPLPMHEWASAEPVTVSAAWTPVGGWATETGVRLVVRAQPRTGLVEVLQSSVDLDVDDVHRYLTNPISSVPFRVFPPPDVTVEAVNRRDLRDIRELAVTLRLNCTEEGLRIRCAPPVERVADLIRFRHEVARIRLGP